MHAVPGARSNPADATDGVEVKRPGGSAESATRVIPIDELLRAGLHLSPADHPEIGTRDVGTIATWKLEGAEMGIVVGGASATVALAILGSDVEDFERDAPALARTASIDQGYRRLYLYRCAAPPRTTPGRRLIGVEGAEAIPLPPADGSRWVSTIGRIVAWPWQEDAEEDPASSPGDAWLCEAMRPSLGEIMEGPKPPPRPSIVGEGLVPEQTLWFLYGPTNVGKTYATLALAHCITIGVPWFCYPTSQCRVGVISPELDLREFWDRYEAVERAEARARNQDPDDPPVAERIRTARSLVHPLTGDRSPRLLDIVKDRDAIIRVCRGLDLKLLILDPLALLNSAGENSNDEMGVVMRALHEIKQQGDVTILVIHHPRKPKPDASDEGIGAMRGAGVLAAHARVVASLQEVNGKKLRLSWPKATHTARPESIYLDRLESGALVQSAPPKGRSAARTERAEVAVRYVMDQQGRAVTAQEILRKAGLAAEVDVPAIRQYLRREEHASNARIEKFGRTRWRARSRPGEAPP